MTTLRFSEDFTIEIGPDIANVSSNSTLDSQMASEVDVTSQVKEITISGGERDVETQKLLGFNESINLKRATVVTCTCTVVGGQGNTDAGYDWQEFLYGNSTSVTGTDYYRHIGGEKSSSDREALAVFIKWTDGTNNIAILLNKAYATTGEWSLAADGTLEQTVTFKCLASNFYYEDDF